jgi:hypothetical protein
MRTCLSLFPEAKARITIDSSTVNAGCGRRTESCNMFVVQGNCGCLSSTFILSLGSCVECCDRTENRENSMLAFLSRQSVPVSWLTIAKVLSQGLLLPKAARCKDIGRNTARRLFEEHVSLYLQSQTRAHNRRVCIPLGSALRVIDFRPIIKSYKRPPPKRYSDSRTASVHFSAGSYQLPKMP